MMVSTEGTGCYRYASVSSQRPVVLSLSADHPLSSGWLLRFDKRYLSLESLRLCKNTAVYTSPAVDFRLVSYENSFYHLPLFKEKRFSDYPDLENGWLCNLNKFYLIVGRNATYM